MGPTFRANYFKLNDQNSNLIVILREIQNSVDCVEILGFHLDGLTGSFTLIKK